MQFAEEGYESGTVLLGKYRIDDRIGRGGMGLVYRAQHLQLDEQVAIKILRASVSLDEEAVQRFQREAQAAVRLKSEHVARILDVGTFEDGTPFMVMEFLAGADLGTMVDENGAMPVGDAVDLVLQACDALAEAHSINIVHRDVKPSNLFVTLRPDGAPMVKILDFGISKSSHGIDLSLTQTASVLGTPAYMSPEQMRSARRVDGRTDIWSLGTVLYELVEGRRPFMAETFSEMCVMAAADPHEPMRYAPQLEPIVARCLAKTPEGRYQSMAELARDLAPFANDPQRAQYYVSRTHRVLGRALTPAPGTLTTIPPTPIPGSLGTPPRGVTPAPTSNALPLAAPITLNADRPRSRAKLVAAVAACALAAAAAVLVITSDRPAAKATEDADVVNMQVEPGSAAETQPGSNGSSGSAAAVAPDVGSAAATAETGSGSGSATTTTADPVAKVGTSKPPRKVVKRPPDKRGSATTMVKGVDPKKNAGSGAPTSSTTKKCDPFASARPCPKT